MNLEKRMHLLNRQNIIIALFIAVSLLSSFVPYFKLDLLISDKIQSINSQPFTSIMWLVSNIGDTPTMLMIVVLTGLLLLTLKLRTEAIISSIAVVGSALSGSLIKTLVDRPRPDANLVRVSVWLSDKSYPSGHVLIFTVFFGFLLYLLFYKSKHKTEGVLLSILFFFLIATIGISRIYLGVHWASDVLGGYLLGVLWLLLAIKLYNFYNGKG